MDSRGKALVAIFLGLLAVALTGTDTPGIGFHEECIDGIDNDGDSAADNFDVDCSIYPYADGNGETETPIGDDYQGDYYEVSFFDYRLNYWSGSSTAYFCDPYEVSGDPGSEMAYYQALGIYSNNKDRAADDYRDWYYANCP